MRKAVRNPQMDPYPIISIVQYCTGEGERRATADGWIRWMDQSRRIVILRLFEGFQTKGRGGSQPCFRANINNRAAGGVGSWAISPLRLVLEISERWNGMIETGYLDRKKKRIIAEKMQAQSR